MWACHWVRFVKWRVRVVIIAKHAVLAGLARTVNLHDGAAGHLDVNVNGWTRGHLSKAARCAAQNTARWPQCWVRWGQGLGRLTDPLLWRLVGDLGARRLLRQLGTANAMKSAPSRKHEEVGSHTRDSGPWNWGM